MKRKQRTEAELEELAKMWRKPTKEEAMKVLEQLKKDPERFETMMKRASEITKNEDKIEFDYEKSRFDLVESILNYITCAEAKGLSRAGITEKIIGAVNSASGGDIILEQVK